ncbi:hypothetical protein, partial [Vibrio sp. YT-17]
QQSKAHQDELDRVEEVHSSQLSQLAEEHKQELAQQSKGYEQDLKHQSELAAQRITSLEVDISELQTERNKALEAVTIAKEEAANIRGQIKGLETALTSRN